MTNGSASQWSLRNDPQTDLVVNSLDLSHGTDAHFVVSFRKCFLRGNGNLHQASGVIFSTVVESVQN